MLRLIVLVFLMVPFSVFADAFVDQLNSMCHFPLSNDNVATQMEVNTCESATWWEDGVLKGVNVTVIHVQHKKGYLPPHIRPGPAPDAAQSVATDWFSSGTECKIIDRTGQVFMAPEWSAEVVARTHPEYSWLADVTYSLRCQIK